MEAVFVLVEDLSMAPGRQEIGKDGKLETKPTKRLAIVWSFNPETTWEDPHQMVGSVLAHIGHLALYGAACWNLVFKVSEDVLSQYDYPLSGYLYNNKQHVKRYRHLECIVYYDRKHVEIQCRE